MLHKVSVTSLEQYQIFYKNGNEDTVLKRAKYPQEDTVRFLDVDPEDMGLSKL